MAKPKVKLISRGMAQLLRDDGVRADLERRIDRVAATARATAPVDSGEYRASIHTESVTTDRAVARVVAGAAHGMTVEAHTGNLARALDSAGGS